MGFVNIINTKKLYYTYIYLPYHYPNNLITAISQLAIIHQNSQSYINQLSSIYQNRYRQEIRMYICNFVMIYIYRCYIIFKPNFLLQIQSIKQMLQEKIKIQSYIGTLIWLFYFIINIQICHLISVPLTSIPQCHSNLLLVYSSGTQLPALTTSNFSYNFPTAYSNMPAMSIGNAGYSSNDRLYNQFWSITYTINNNFTGFIVHVRLQSNTRTNVQYVHYFAVDDSSINPGLFSIYYSEYNTVQLVNTSRSSGNRADTIEYIPAGPASFSTDSLVHCVTNTVWMRNNNNYGFTVSCELLLKTNLSTNTAYSQSLKFVISSTGQNILQKIGIYTIVVNQGVITGVNYYQAYVGEYTVYTGQNQVDAYNLDFNYSSVSGVLSYAFQELADGNRMIAFSGWGGSAASFINFNCQFGTDSGRRFIRFSMTMTMTFINYKYLIFGKVNCVYWSIDQQNCVSSCAQNQTNYAGENICRLCVSPCVTCTNSPILCNSCINTYFLQNSTCHTCNSSNLTISQKGLCNISDVPQNHTPTQKNIQPSPPYWLAVFGIIPLIVLLVIFFIRNKRLKASVSEKVDNEFKQYPSIEL